MEALVLLTINTLVPLLVFPTSVLPGLAFIGPLHGSVVGIPAGSSVPKVGRGDGVKLGMDVGLGNGVLAGTGVDGTAALVIAAKVFTMAIAEACTWAESVVGIAFAPQALSRKPAMTAINIKRFTILSPFDY
jgi:hypothetical protein